MNKIVWIAALLAAVIVLTASVLSTSFKLAEGNSDLELRVATLEAQNHELETACAGLSSNLITLANGTAQALKTYGTVINNNRAQCAGLNSTFLEYYGARKWNKMVKAAIPEPKEAPKK